MGAFDARSWDRDDGARLAFEPDDEYDMPADVDATFRTVRRVGVGHFAVFLGVVVAVPVLTLTVGWWSDGRLAGGMSPSFVMAAFGLYVFFFALSAAAATLANAVEERMLGDPDEHRPYADPDEHRPGPP